MIEVPVVLDQVSGLKAIQSLYTRPLLGFKEYISNSLDAAVNNNVNVSVTIDKRRGIIVVQDDARGIPWEQMQLLPGRIGNSFKKTDQGTIGSKAFGLLGFGSAKVQKVELYSVIPSNPDQVSYLELTTENPNLARIDVSDKSLLKYGPLDHGTQVVLSGLEKDIIETYYVPNKLIPLLSATFSPSLRKGKANILVTYKASGSGSKSTQVEPVNYNGELVVEDSILLRVLFREEIEGTERIKEIEGTVGLYLFVNPKGTSERVGHFNHGVRVVPSIASYDQLSKNPWGLGKLSGEIDEDFLRLNPNREGLDQSLSFNGVNLETFIDCLLQREPELNSHIQKLKSQREKHDQDMFMRKLLAAMDLSYRDMEENPIWARGGKRDPVKTVSPAKESGHVIPEGPGPGHPGVPGRTTYIENPHGTARHVTPAKRPASLYNWSFEDFPMEEQGLRSMLDESIHNIKINQSHPEFLASKDTGKEVVHTRYIAFQVAKEMARVAFEARIKEETVLPNDYHLLTEMTSDLYHRAIKLMDIQE